MQVVYEIVEHDGGWAYKSDGVFSEAFPTREEAIDAAKAATAEQRVPGETVPIEYEDENGRWRIETSPGTDRPDTVIRLSSGG